MKKYGVILILILLLGTILYSYKPLLTTIGADSGWDSSYDSGGGSSSSSWPSSDSSSSIESYSEGNWFDFVFIELCLSINYFVCLSILFEKIFKRDKKAYILIGIIIIIRWIIAVLLEKYINYKWIIPSAIGAFALPAIFLAIDIIVEHIDYKKYQKQQKRRDSNNLKIWNKISTYLDLDNKQVTEELYRIFIDVQNAWMNFDYDKLKELCSDELYNSYKKDLEILKLKDGQNIMNSFRPKEMYIKKATRRDNALEIEFYLDIKFKDYVINTKTNKVIRGSKHQTIHNKYRLVYQKQDFYMDKCPSCGKELPATSNTTCPSCNSIIINNTNKYILVFKEIIRY